MILKLVAHAVKISEASYLHTAHQTNDTYAWSRYHS